MIYGAIKTKDILFHPFCLLTEFGVKKSIYLYCKALSWKSYQFLPLVLSFSENEQNT